MNTHNYGLQESACKMSGFLLPYVKSTNVKSELPIKWKLIELNQHPVNIREHDLFYQDRVAVRIGSL